MIAFPYSGVKGYLFIWGKSCSCKQDVHLISPLHVRKMTRETLPDKGIMCKTKNVV